MRSTYQNIKWLAASLLILCGYCQQASAQFERAITDFSYYQVLPKAETYDGGILYLVENNNFNPYINYVAKYGLEGKRLWSIKLDKSLIPNDLIATSDSGFAIAGALMYYYKDSGLDSAYFALVLKFDKCAKLQWGRYIKTGYNGVLYNMIADKNGNIIVCGDGFSNVNDYNGKPITLLKFNKNGDLINTAAYEGQSATLFYDQFKDQMYLSQYVNLHFLNDTTYTSPFTCIKQINTKLECTAKNVAGYTDKKSNTPGPIVIKSNGAVSVNSVFLKTPNNIGAMFNNWDNNLAMKGSYSIDADTKYMMNPVAACGFGDSTIVINLMQSATHSWDSFYTSIRVYDGSFKVLSEAILNKYWHHLPNALLPLRDGNRFIAQVTDYNGTVPHISNVYLYDRNLTPQQWPTTVPAKGYDWGCNTNITYTKTISFDSTTMKGVTFIPDTISKPDWHWLYHASIQPEPQDISNGCLIYPQPATIGQGLYLQLQSLTMKQSTLQVRFYDMQGREVLVCNALAQGNGEWYINHLALPGTGLYVARLYDKDGGLAGNVKVVVGR